MSKSIDPKKKAKSGKRRKRAQSPEARREAQRERMRKRNRAKKKAKKKDEEEGIKCKDTGVRVYKYPANRTLPLGFEDAERFLPQLVAQSELANKDLVAAEMERRKSEEGLSIADVPFVENQFFLSQRVRNDTVEIDHEMRAIDMEAMLKTELKDEILEVEAEYAEINKALHAVYEGQRKRNQKNRDDTLTPKERREISALSKKRKKVWKERQKICKRARKLDSYDKGAVDNARSDAALEGRRRFPDIFWTTRNRRHEALKQHRKGAPPKFKKWDGSGLIGGQVHSVQSQQAPEVVFGGDLSQGNARVVRYPDGVWVPGKNRAARKGDAILYLRVGSVGRKPLWARFPFHMKRELPEGVRITYAAVVRKKEGRSMKWSVQLTLGDVGPRPDRAKEGTVAIDVGWRYDNGSIVVATFSASNGREGKIVLPRWWLREAKKVEELQSIVRKDFNEAVDSLIAYFKVEGRDCIPKDLRKEFKNLHHFRSPKKLSKLVKKWRDQDEGSCLDWLWYWRGRQLHLGPDWRDPLRGQLQGSRKDLYRRFARDMGRSFKHCVIEKMNLAHMQERNKAGDNREKDRINKNKRHAALSVLKKALQDVFFEDIDTLNPAYTSKTCWSCGKRNYNLGSAQTFTCSCGETWNRDVNASRNLLAASGAKVDWDRPALEPDEVWTYSEKPNKRRRKTIADKRALEAKRKNEDSEEA